MWTHIELIRIIDNNWPDLIEKHRLQGVTSLAEKLDDEKYAMLRKANMSAFVEVEENKVFGLIGGGYASDGSSVEAVRTSDHWYNYIRNIELYIREDYQSFKRQLLLFDSHSRKKSWR